MSLSPPVWGQSREQVLQAPTQPTAVILPPPLTYLFPYFFSLFIFGLLFPDIYKNRRRESICVQFTILSHSQRLGRGWVSVFFVPIAIGDAGHAQGPVASAYGRQVGNLECLTPKPRHVAMESSLAGSDWGTLGYGERGQAVRG